MRRWPSKLNWGSAVRYWINGEDEDYERELDRVKNFGGIPPALTAPLTSTLLPFLIAIQVLLFVSVIVQSVMSLR